MVVAMDPLRRIEALKKALEAGERSFRRGSSQATVVGSPPKGWDIEIRSGRECATLYGAPDFEAVARRLLRLGFMAEEQ